MNNLKGVMKSMATTKEALMGKNTVLLFRLLKEQGTQTAVKLAFQTEHELTESRDTDTTATKDGNIVTPSALETSLDCTSILAKGDDTADKLRQALRDYEKIEIWEVDLSTKGTSGADAKKYKAMYYQGYVSEWSKSPSAEDSIELSLTFTIEGVGQSGFVTLTPEQENVVKYVFKDVTPVTG